MSTNFHIIAVPHRDPDLDRIVAVLVALAVTELEKDRDTAGAKEARE